MNITSIISSAPAVAQVANDWLRTKEYLLVDSESLTEVLRFDSCISLDLKTDGEVVSTPIEEGSFMTYNKAVGPDEIDVTLAIQGETNQLQAAIEKLKKLQQQPRKLTFVAPMFSWGNMSIETYSFSLKLENGIGVLYVDLVLVEIREVTTQYTDTKPITSSKKAGNASTVSKGKQQAKTPTKEQETSAMFSWTGRIL